MKTNNRTVVIFALWIAWHFSSSDARAQSAKLTTPPARAEGQHGVVVGVTGPAAVSAGLDVLKDGGSAADAALSTALAQIVECGGSYVSFAGILSLVYFDAEAGRLHYLNAGFNVPRDENDPRSITSGGKSPGRSVLVPGFMAAVQAAHDRFGKLSRQRVFAPAIMSADAGFKVSRLLAALLQDRKRALAARPEAKRIFAKDGDHLYVEGELLRQPELANTLRRIADDGAAYMYKGNWADRFVAAVKAEGGKITLDDMRSYGVIWESPLEAHFRQNVFYVPGKSSLGGITMVEALHILQCADLRKFGHYSETPKSLFWLMQIANCQALSYLSPDHLKSFDGLDLRRESRVKMETATNIWRKMQDGTWPLASASASKGSELAPNHSDGVVVVDRWGNVAALTHTINTEAWGESALFVDGISIPEPAAFQQDAIQMAGPGHRLPDPMCPLIVLKNSQPILACSAIGGGLHQKTVQVLESIYDLGIDPQAAVELPAFMLPDFSAQVPTARVERGAFDAAVLASVRTMGQQVKEIPVEKAGPFRGYWIGVEIHGAGIPHRGIGTRQAPLPSVAEAY
jgi:gamma-glutamyltranspeptidase/glutathione hydrolase